MWLYGDSGIHCLGWTTELKKPKKETLVPLPDDLVLELQELGDGRGQTIPELLSGMLQEARGGPVFQAPVPDPVDAVRTGRSQDYVRPGYDRKQRPETEAEKRIYFGE